MVQRLYRLMHLRPSSDPYLSGDGFRSLTPWRYEPEAVATFDPLGVPGRTVIFCEAWLLEDFLRSVAPRLSGPVVVVAGNGDPNFTEPKLSWIPPQVEALFVQNCEVRDPRVHPLPIGLENARLHTNGVVADFRALRRKPAPTVNRVLWGFSEVTNPIIRTQARQVLELVPTAVRLATTHSRAYRKSLSKYRFVASPPGNGVDCHRTWEALYLRVVPIVLRSTLTELLSELGLPLWVVDSYEELQRLTELDLERIYSQFESSFDHPALWMDYWKRAIFQTSERA